MLKQEVRYGSMLLCGRFSPSINISPLTQLFGFAPNVLAIQARSITAAFRARSSGGLADQEHRNSFKALGAYNPLASMSDAFTAYKRIVLSALQFESRLSDVRSRADYSLTIRKHRRLRSPQSANNKRVRGLKSGVTTMLDLSTIDHK